MWKSTHYQVVEFVAVKFNDAIQSDVKPITTAYGEQTKEAVRALVDGNTNQPTAMWFGYTSSGEDGVRWRWNKKYKVAKMTKIAMVYKTDKIEDATGMEKYLITQWENLSNKIGGGSGPTGQPPFIVYVAWTKEDPYSPPLEVAFGEAIMKNVEPLVDAPCDEVRAKILSLVDVNDGMFYVGKTSGDEPSGADGCSKRWNGKYKAYGYNRIAAVYRSKDEDSALALEKGLIKSLDNAQNPNEGGGGNQATDATYYFIYVAWFDKSVKP